MRLVGLGVVLVLLAGCVTEEPDVIASPRAAEIAAGRQIAEAHCASCHAIGLTDESRHPLAPPFRVLDEHYPLVALEEALAEGILVGHSDMPPFEFEPAEIDQLIAYLTSVQRAP